jgi:hypothetical protein
MGYNRSEPTSYPMASERGICLATPTSDSSTLRDPAQDASKASSTRTASALQDLTPAEGRAAVRGGINSTTRPEED